MNDELKGKDIYTKAQWRLNQSMLDIGNAAAQGKFEDYDQEAVKRMLEDIERFMAQYYLAT